MPSFSIPPEIFDHLRRELRDQSGIPSYDPTDPSIPNLQPYESCISQVDPSQPYLRCRHCKGRLLRGVNSMLCVFCGKERFGEAMPDPLNFRDSKGYAWLLEALDLDGSENVVQIYGEEEPYREKDRAKDEIRLSDLLSLEIKSAFPVETPANSGVADYAQPKSSLNLGGVNLDNFFGETNDVDSSTAENKSGAVEGSWASESNVTQAPSNLRLFGNVPLPCTTVNSTNQENRNSLSAWEAEFQSAASETAQRASPSPDPFSGSSVDVSAHMDAMFGSGNEPKRNNAKPSSSNMDNWFDEDPRGDSNIGFNRKDFGPKPSHNPGPKPSSSEMDKWFDDDLGGNSNIGFVGQDLGPKPSHDTGHSGVGPSDSATDYAWIEGNQWLSNAAGASKSERSDEDDAWNDFTSSTNAVENNEWKQAHGVATSNPTPPGDLYGSSIDLMADFGFLGQDLFPVVSSISMKPVNLSSVQSQASTSDSVINMEAKEGSKEAVKQEGMNATSSELDQLQMLMSQMHDLSFMLDHNLSIPSMSGKTSSSEK